MLPPSTRPTTPVGSPLKFVSMAKLKNRPPDLSRLVPNYIFSTIFELFISSCFVFNAMEKVINFQVFFLKIATFFQKSQTFNKYHVRILIYLSLVA